MRVKTGLAVGMLATLVAGCYPPKPCAPNDPSCLPCSDPRSADPSCPGWPNDNGDNPSTMTKKPDGGTR